VNVIDPKVLQALEAAGLVAVNKDAADLIAAAKQLFDGYTITIKVAKDPAK
jgi:ribosomal protein S19E (S16A)